MLSPIVYNLSKLGYGTYKELIELPINEVLDMANYEKFCNNYQLYLTNKNETN